jgi:hypothetical protein
LELLCPLTITIEPATNRRPRILRPAAKTEEGIRILFSIKKVNDQSACPGSAGSNPYTPGDTPKLPGKFIKHALIQIDETRIRL